MLYACWSLKGGVGTTTFAAALGVSWSREGENTLLVDLTGDVTPALGLISSSPLGVMDWLNTEAVPETGALGRLEEEVSEKLNLLPRGRGELQKREHINLLLRELQADHRRVVLDCGSIFDSGFPVAEQDASEADYVFLRRTVAEHASERSWLVIRPCYLALRRMRSYFPKPSGIVLIEENERVLEAVDVSEILAAPITASIAFDPIVGRAVDAGLLAKQFPPKLVKTLNALS